jgi:hypothetical protein
MFRGVAMRIGRILEINTSKDLRDSRDPSCCYNLLFRDYFSHETRIVQAGFGEGAFPGRDAP